MQRIRTIATILILGIISTPTLGTYTNEENSDSSKSFYGAVNSILGANENTHTERKNTFDGLSGGYDNVPGNYFNGPTAPAPCTGDIGCPLPARRTNQLDKSLDIDNQRAHFVDTNRVDVGNPNFNGAGQMDVRSSGYGNGGGITQNYPTQNYPTQNYPIQNYPAPNYAHNAQPSVQNYPRYPQNNAGIAPQQGYYPGQIDPGFARFPPPEQGGPMRGYGAPDYRYPVQQQPYPYNGHQHQHQHHHHSPQYHGSYEGEHGYNTLDHSLKSNTEYTEVGHRESGFQGNTNQLGYGSGYGGTYNGAYNRPGY